MAFTAVSLNAEVIRFPPVPLQKQKQKERSKSHENNKQNTKNNNKNNNTNMTTNKNVFMLWKLYEVNIII